MILGDWTGEAAQAMQENPRYFAWWYTVKSVGLAVVLAAFTYQLGKNHGRR